MNAKNITDDFIIKQIQHLYGKTVTIHIPGDTDKIDNLIKDYNNINDVNRCIIFVIDKKLANE